MTKRTKTVRTISKIEKKQVMENSIRVTERRKGKKN